MKITQDVRDYAAEKGIEVEAALEAGLADKAAEYRRQRLAAQQAEAEREVGVGVE